MSKVTLWPSSGGEPIVVPDEDAAEQLKKKGWTDVEPKGGKKTPVFEPSKEDED